MRHSTRSRIARIGAATAAVAATAVLVTACSSGTPAASGAGTDPDATLNVGALLAPTNLDIRNTSGAALDQALLDNVYQGLVTLDEDGQVVPAIAKSWTVSSDGLTYDFTLNDGVTFSDGKALTTDDVVASLQDAVDSAKSATTDKPAYNGAAGLAGVDEVVAKDDSTIELTLTKPNIETLWVLAGRGGIILEQGAESSPTTAVVGTGPFTVGDFQANTSLTLERNEQYWGTKAGVKEVVFHYYADAATAENAVLAGTDQVLVAITPADLPKFSGNQDLDVVQGTAGDKWQLSFNNTDPVLADKSVREAIREAIDPKAILAAVGGVGSELGGPIANGDPGYEDLTSIDAYDPDDAKAKFAAAGVTSLTLTIPSPYGTVISDVLTSELKDVGVTLTVDQVDFNTWLANVYSKTGPQDYQLTIIDHVESHDFGTQWVDAATNYKHYTNPQVDALYAQALQATSADDEAKLLAQAARLVSEDAASEWLYQGAVSKAVAKGVSGVPANNTNSRLNLGSVTVSAAD